MGSDRQAVRDTLQKGYGDATQTVLDDRVAGDILQTLRERGWASLDVVAAIIDAAGGEVRLTEAGFMRVGLEDVEVIVHEDPLTGDRVLRTRHKF